MADKSKVEAALQVLRAMDVDPTEVAAAAEKGLSSCPTVAEFAPQALALMPPPSRSKYRGYIDVLVNGLPSHCWCTCEKCAAHPRGCQCKARCECPKSEAPVLVPSKNGASFSIGTAIVGCADRVSGLGSVRLDQVTTGQLIVLTDWIRKRAQKRWVRRNAKRAANDRHQFQHDGRGAVEGAIRAWRSLFNAAVSEKHITTSPAESLRVPRRQAQPARRLTNTQLQQLWDALVTTGSNDPELDELIVWFQLETGARRGGPVNLQIGFLNQERQTIRVIEKYGDVREQPVTSELIEALLAHAERRGTCDGQALTPASPVFYYRPKTDKATGQKRPHPLTTRRFDSLYERLRKTVPWADEMFMRPHDLRKTAGSLVERVAGYETARSFLGHHGTDVTQTYTSATIEEVAAAISVLTGEPHPLAGEQYEAE